MARPIIIRIDASGAVSGGRQAEQAIKEVRQESQRLKTDASRMNESLERSNRSFQSLSRSAHLLRGSLTAIAASLVVRQVVAYADAWTQVSSAIRIATDSSAAAAEAQERVFEIAQKTRAPLLETATLYARISQASNELGASQADVARVVQTVTQSLAINNTSTATAAGALLQLSQVFGGARVEMADFRSLIDGLRPLLVVAAKNIDGLGGSVNALIRRVRDSKLDTQTFFRAIVEGSAESDRLFANATATVSKGLTTINNSLTRFVGVVDEATGATEKFGKTASLTARGIDFLTEQVDKANDIMSHFSAEVTIRQLRETEESIIAIQKVLAAIDVGTVSRFDLGVLLQGGVAGLQSRLAELETLAASFRAELTHLTEAAEQFGMAASRSAFGLGEMAKGILGAIQLAPDKFFEEVAKAQAKSAREAERAAQAAERLAEAFAKERQAVADEITLLQTELAAVTALNAGRLSEAEALEIVNRKTDELSGKLPEEISLLSALRTAIENENQAREANNAALEENTRLTDEALAAGIAAAQSSVDFTNSIEEQIAVLERENAILAEVAAGTLTHAEGVERLADANLDAAAAQHQLDQNQQASVETLKQVRAENENLKTSINTTGAAALDLVDVFDKAFEGIVLGTRKFGSFFEAAGLKIAKDFGKQFLFGKQKSFDIPFLGNISGLVGQNGVIGGLFSQGGAQAASLFGAGFSSVNVTGQLFSGPNPSGGTGFSPLLSSPGGGPSGLTGFFNNLGSVAAGAFGIGFSETLKGVLGISGGAAGQAAGIGGGVIGAGIGASFGGPLGAFLGAVAGDAFATAFTFGIGQFFKKGRIELEKESIEDFFQSALSRGASTFKERNVAQALFDAEDFRDAGFALGTLFADSVSKATQGTPIRFGGQLLANELQRFGNSTEEITADFLTLAAALEFSVAGTIEEVNKQVEHGFLSMSVFQEEMAEARKNLKDFGDTATLTRQELEDLALANGNTGSVVLDYASLLAGVLDLQTQFNADINASILVNELLADNFIEVARAAGVSEAQIRDLGGALRDGVLSLEEVAAAVEGVSLADLTLSPEDFAHEVALIQAALVTLGDLGDTLAASLGQELDPGFVEGLFDQIFGNAIVTAVQTAYREAFSASALFPFLQDFGQALADFVAGSITAEEFSVMTAGIRSDMGPAVAELEAAFIKANEELLALLDSLGLLPGSVAAAARGIPGSVTDFIGGAPPIDTSPVEDLAAATRAWFMAHEDLIEALNTGAITVEEHDQAWRDLDESMRRSRKEIVEAALATGEALTESVFPPTLQEQQDAYNDAVNAQIASLEALRDSGLLAAEDIGRLNAQIADLELARALFPLQEFVASLNALPQTLSTEISNLLIQAFRDANFDVGQVDFAQLEQQATAFVADAIFAATLQAITNAFIVAPISAAITPAFAAAGALIIAGGTGAAAAIGTATLVLADVLGALPALFEALTDFFDTPEFAAFLAAIEEATGGSLPTGGGFATSGGGGGGGGGGGTTSVQEGVQAIEDALDAIREFAADDVVADLRSSLESIRREASGLLESLVTAMFDPSSGLGQLNAVALSATNLARAGSGMLAPSAVAQQEQLLADLAQAVVDAATGLAKGMTEALHATLQPAQQFLESIEAERDPFEQLAVDFQAAQAAIAEASSALGDLIDLTEVEAAVTEALSERIRLLIEDAVSPLTDLIDELASADLRSVADILSDVASADSFAALGALQSELVATIQANLQEEIDAIEAASQATIRAIEEERDAALAALKVQQDAELKVLEDQLQMLRDMQTFLEDIGDTFDDFRARITESVTPLSEVLGSIAEATTLTELQDLQAAGFAAILHDLEQARTELQRLFDDQFRLLEEERSLTERHIELFRDAARSLRENIIDAQLGPQSFLTPSEQLGLGLAELTQLQQQITNDPTNQDAIQRFLELLNQVRDLNISVNAGSAEALLVNEQINAAAEAMAVLLEGQIPIAEQQLAAIDAQTEVLQAELQEQLDALLQSAFDQTDALEQALIAQTEVLSDTQEILILESAIADLQATFEEEIATLSAVFDEAIQEEQDVLEAAIRDLQQEMAAELTAIVGVFEAGFHALADTTLASDITTAQSIIESLRIDVGDVLTDILGSTHDMLDALGILSDTLKDELSSLVAALVSGGSSGGTGVVDAGISAVLTHLDSSDAVRHGQFVATDARIQSGVDDLSRQIDNLNIFDLLPFPRALSGTRSLPVPTQSAPPPAPLSVSIPLTIVTVDGRVIREEVHRGVIEMRDGNHVFVSIDNIDEQSIQKIGERISR